MEHFDFAHLDVIPFSIMHIVLVNTQLCTGQRNSCETNKPQNQSTNLSKLNLIFFPAYRSFRLEVKWFQKIRE